MSHPGQGLRVLVVGEDEEDVRPPGDFLGERLALCRHPDQQAYQDRQQEDSH